MNTFLYDIETGQTPSQEVIMRSAQWRRLRKALADLSNDEWLKITVNGDGGIPHGRVAERLRAAVHTYAMAAKDTLNGAKMITRAEKLDDRTVVWICKKTLAVVQ